MKKFKQLIAWLLRFFDLSCEDDGIDYLCGGEALPAPLTPEEEQAVVKRLNDGDVNAKNELIERNLRLVVYISKRFENTGIDMEDLISVGTIGLIKAIDSFNIDNGARFATYAGKCLQNEILMYFRAQKKQSMENSLSDAVDVDKDGNPLTYMDILSVDDDIIDEIDLRIRSAKLYKAISEKLDDRERTVITLRYGLNGGRCYTQREVAERLGISRSYVSRIEKVALEKIREAL